jgi:hypothetical protein
VASADDDDIEPREHESNLGAARPLAEPGVRLSGDAMTLLDEFEEQVWPA